jgi:integrase
MLGRHPEYVFTLKLKKRGIDFDGTPREKGDYVPLVPGTFWQEMHEALLGAGISDFTIHNFRHTAATRLLRVCGNVEIVRKFLGHVDQKSVQRYIQDGRDES